METDQIGRTDQGEESYVRITDLRKTFNQGEVVAVDNVDISIGSDELVVLVGPSGCGKTTTLRCVSGFEKPDSGQITIAGNDVTYKEPKDRNIAFVFQDIALFPHMTVRQNIRFGLDMKTDLDADERKKRVEDVAELLDIGELVDRKPSELSGGQQQRVSIGRAMIMEPNVFLLDEPFSNLDANLRDRMQTEIKRIQRRLETTMIFVTHDQQEAMTLGDKLAVMNDGLVVQLGEPYEIYNDPNSRFVAGFIGSPPTNFTDASLRKDGDVVEVTNETFSIQLDEGGFEEFSKWDSSVEVAFRPEYVNFDTADPLFTASLDVIEHQGDRDAVYFSKNGQEFVGVAPQNTTDRDRDTIDVSIDESQIWVFDSDGERVY
jgi:multiple sugar transport system ATP-binding protein